MASCSRLRRPLDAVSPARHRRTAGPLRPMPAICEPGSAADEQREEGILGPGFEIDESESATSSNSSTTR